jgi:hypothetical protein
MSDVIIKTLWIYGLAIVVSMAVAVVIKVIVVVLNAFERKLEAAAKPAPAPAAPAFDLLSDHVAAISAAVYSVIGAHRIVHIEEHRDPGWVVEGRLAHHTSHAVSHHPKR